MTKLANVTVLRPGRGDVPSVEEVTVTTPIPTSIPSTDEEIWWCQVGAWNSVLTRRAHACTEYVSAGSPGYIRGYVRHWALGEQLDKGRDAAGNAARLTRMKPADKAGLAIAGPYRLAAEIINKYRLGLGAGKFVKPIPPGAHPNSPAAHYRQQECDEIEVAWRRGSDRATVTGTSPRVAWRRAAVYQALSTAGNPLTADDLERWDQCAIEHGTYTVILAIQAGHVTSEVTAAMLTEMVGLAEAAAINGHFDSFVAV